jgi:hypothetical protein
MSRKLIAVTFILATAFSITTEAREGRGQHETKVKCGEVNGIADARKCFKEVGAKMPTENDDNAVFVVKRSQEARALLSEILTAQEKTEDIAKVEDSDYIAAIVQNDDEASIYYYTLKNGANAKPVKVGHTIAVVDFGYDVCGEDSSFDKKFAQVQNQLLGMTKEDSVAGSVWLDDIECEE